MSYSAQAQATVGQLLEHCEAFELDYKVGPDHAVTIANAQATLCFGYFRAVHHLAFVYLEDSSIGMLQFCPPAEATTVRFIRIFLAHARANPQNHHLDPAAEVLTALALAFPCKQ
jgi:hypothetical protein